MARPLPPDKSTRARAQGGLVSAKIPGLMTLRPASRGVHHHLALLARGRGRHHAQDSHQPRARAAGAVPLSAARREGKETHTSPARRGSASVQRQKDVLLPDCPARRGSTGRLHPPNRSRDHRPAWPGARFKDRRPGVRTPGRDTPPPGAMRNLRVPEDADSGDCYQRVEHPPPARILRAGGESRKRAPARWRRTAPRRRPDTRPR